MGGGGLLGARGGGGGEAEPMGGGRCGEPKDGRSGGVGRGIGDSEEGHSPLQRQ
jgi:hypothetical protein